MNKSLVALKRFLDPRYQNLFLDYKVDLKSRYGHGKPPHKTLFDIINSNRAMYKEILHDMLVHEVAFASIKSAVDETDEFSPVYNNGFLPGLDIFGIYTMIAKYKPNTYVEVGSGNSTKVAHLSIENNNLGTRIVSIDPCPRAEIDKLASKIIREPFENVDFDFLFSLEENDILFIDNSHRILPNSDSMVFYMEVLPNLPNGVIVHVHDIYLPYDYPQFMCDRCYSEQYGLAMYLLANSAKYQTLLPNYFIHQDEELGSIINPLWNNPNLAGVERHGGSFWFVVN